MDISTWRTRLTPSVRVEMMDCVQILALFYWLQYCFVKWLKRETMQRVREEKRTKRSRTRRKHYRQYARTGYSAWIHCSRSLPQTVSNVRVSSLFQICSNHSWHTLHVQCNWVMWVHPQWLVIQFDPDRNHIAKWIDSNGSKSIWLEPV